MSSPTPPEIPPPLPPESGQWAYPTNAKGEPKKKYVLWVVIGAAGCFVLLLVLGIVATFFIPRIKRKVDEARSWTVKHKLAELHARLFVYAQTHGGQYPDSLEALELPDLVRDLWGHPIVYEPPTREHREPRVYSLGRDGQPGGVGEDADIHEDLDPAAGR